MVSEVMPARRGIRISWPGAIALPGVCFVAGAAVTLGMLAQHGVPNQRWRDHADLARIADEYYPVWLAEHSLDYACPKSLADLGDGMRYDRWERELRVVCVPGHGATESKPAERTTFVVISAGPDGHFGTPDDIRSDRD